MFTEKVLYWEYLGSGHLDGTDIHEAVDAAAAVEKAGYVPRFYTIDMVRYFLFHFTDVPLSKGGGALYKK